MMVVALAVSLVAFLPSALAQQQLRQPRSSVDIDWTVLDELGPGAASRPRLTPPAPRTVQPAVRAPRRMTSETEPPKADSAAHKKAPAVKLTPPAPKPTSATKPSAPPFTKPTPPPSFTDKPPPARTPPVAASAPPRAIAPTAAAPAAPAQAVAAAPLPPPPAAVAATPAAAPPAPIAEAPKPPQPTAAAEPTKPQAPASPPAIPAASTAPVKPLDPPAAPAVPAAPGQQLAALSTAAVGADGRLARIDFAIGGAELPEVARPALERAIGEMKRDENARLQLIAYASGGDEAGSQARRLSLSRALAVRSYLIDQGVRSTRVDVRALGNKVPEGPPDRVDVLLVRR